MGAVEVVFPSVNEEAIEDAERGEERGVDKQCGEGLRIPHESGSERCSSEVEAHDEFLWKLRLRRMHKQEPTDEDQAFNEVKVQGCGKKAGKQCSDADSCNRNDSEKCAPVAEVEKVTCFQFRGPDAVRGMKVPGVEETVGCVENPDGEKHGSRRDHRQSGMCGSRHEQGPESGDGWGVEREQVPEGERTGGAERGRDLGGGCHYFDFRGFRGGSRFESRDSDASNHNDGQRLRLEGADRS